MGRAYNFRNTQARKSRNDSPGSRKRQSKKAHRKETNNGEKMEASATSEEIRKKGNEAFKKFKYCAQRPLQKGFLTEAIQVILLRIILFKDVWLSLFTYLKSF